MKVEGTRYTKQERDALRAKLADKQQLIKEKKLPVIVMIEGYSAAGKGSAISGTIQLMDPRFFKVYNMDSISEEEWKRPFLYRYAIKMPENGQFSIYDGGYIDEIAKDYLSGSISEEAYNKRIKSVADYERSMNDNGYLFIKIFLNVSKHEQKERLKALKAKKSTKWRVTEEDIWQNECYEEFAETFSDLLAQTNADFAPWHIIENVNKKDTECDIISIISNAVDARIAQDEATGKVHPIPDNPFEMVGLEEDTDTYYDPSEKQLEKISLADKIIEDDEYKKELKSLRKRLKKLHNKLYKKKIPLIIAYEGWDAAGKGGNIKRIASALDARGYEVFPIASPSPAEKNRHFLYRFYTRLPKFGHIAIFDRTWYGRVMVERLEGFCSENDWQRAYNEINEFERDLTDEGAIIIKFWVHIDKDTQLQRFNDRAATPEKQWKITDEDWRNREKWDLYEEALEDMIKNTSTSFAPWRILESNDKKYARIKALKIIIQAIEERL